MEMSFSTAGSVKQQGIFTYEERSLVGCEDEINYSKLCKVHVAVNKVSRHN